MEGFEGRIGLAAVALMFAAVMLPELAVGDPVRHKVGDRNGGWGVGANLTVWAKDEHFYKGDWLYFVYDRNQMDVLEVNKSGYDNCTIDHPLHNWTGGAGRDAVGPLNVTKTYYFTTSKGYCYSGVKLEVHVENPPPPPSSSPSKSGSPSNLLSTFRAQVFVPALFAVGAFWDSFILLM